MTLPFDLPDWVPHWVVFAAVVVAGLLGLALLLMPFSVFGTKNRLDAIEARLDEIQNEIRSLALRLPEAGARRFATDDDADTPPIPPRMALPVRRPSGRSGRSEPRFDPRQ